MKTPITPQGLPPQTAEDYLRGRYGAYRGHFAWRELEEAFNVGFRSQAASVEPVNGAFLNTQGGVTLCANGTEKGHRSFAGHLYAGAPPAPVSVQDEALVEKLAKRTCEANADSARFTIALQTLRASLDPDDWMGAVTMHNYIDAVLAGGSPLSQPPAVAASSPATAVDAVESLRAELDDMREQRDEALRGPWKDWAERLMNRVRKGSGYDGYDDADGVDLAGEVIEHLDIVEADNERLAAELAALQASRQPQAQRGWALDVDALATKEQRS